MAAIPTSTEIGRLLAEWNEWLAARTDALLSLEDRVRTAGSADDEADVAAAFVARKALADRLGQVATKAHHDRAAASALTTQPLVDDLGGPVGSNITDAAELLDAIVKKVEQRVGRREGQQLAEASAMSQVDADLAVAERLSADLGLQVNQVAELRVRSASRDHLAELATESATVRSSLEAAAKERTGLLQRWSVVGGRLAELTVTEARVRELAARCREKILQAPPLAVPSVAALDVEVGDVSGLTWVATRARITPVLAKVDRLAAALLEAERRFRAAIDRREELRGLLQAFADKASAHNVMESPELDALYQEGKLVLWTAPCDIDRGTAIVDQYITAVNAKVKEAAR